MDPAEWLLTKSERGNAQTGLDARHFGENAWSSGNFVRPLVHGATYFSELAHRIQETRAGDAIYFTDWRGDPDERLADDAESAIEDLLSEADIRGVDVRGLGGQRPAGSAPTRPPATHPRSGAVDADAAVGSSPVPGRARPRRTPQGIAEAPSVLRLGASRESFSTPGSSAPSVFSYRYWLYSCGRSYSAQPSAASWVFTSRVSISPGPTPEGVNRLRGLSLSI
jgi:hypothetical protein